MKSRIYFIISAFFVLFVAIIIRLFYWQIIKGKKLSIEAKGQYLENQSLIADRGDIMASDRSWLAVSEDAWLLYASLPDITDKAKNIAEKLAPIFIDEELKDKERKEVLLNEIDRIESLLTRNDVVWVPIKSKVSIVVKKEIEDMEIDGLGFEQTEKRSYPEASSAAHLLGFVGKNEEGIDQGYFGLEGNYDLVLSGKPGFVRREKDASGVPILEGDDKEIDAVKGVNLLTHIDKTVQLIIEEKLKEGMEKYGSDEGTVIVMDPKSGAVLGMSSYPSYDPDSYYDYGDEFFTNPAISDAFEPGSVFKVIVMASALDAGVVEPETKCDVCSGPYRVGEYSIETWNNEYNPDSTMSEVIVHSDNVGMSFVSEKLGFDNMYDYLERFGIGKKTGIDLQGEANIFLRDKKYWGKVELATASFGQGVAITPIQLIKGVSAIANSGIMMTPQVVDKIEVDGWQEDIKPVSEGRVISEKAAKEITAMMAEAAKSGEAKWTYLKGFKVAGKTGTAQIPIAGHYDAEKTIASFIGFVPYDDPKFIMLVTLKEPKTSPWASETAAPLWYSIAKDLFSYFGIQPEN